MGPDSDSSGGGFQAPGLVLKALVLVGGALLLKRLRKSTTQWDHARVVAEALSGEKVTKKVNIFSIMNIICSSYALWLVFHV